MKQFNALPPGTFPERNFPERNFAAFEHSLNRVPNGPRAAECAGAKRRREERARAGRCPRGSTNVGEANTYKLDDLISGFRVLWGSYPWPCARQLWLPLLSASLVVCNLGMHVVAQQPSPDRPPRPPQSPATAQHATTQPATTEHATAEPAVKAEPFEDAGVRSSTWSQSPERPAVNHELSVAPSTLPLLPEDAPAWVGSVPDLTDDVHRLFVGGQIAESESEATQELDAPLVRAVRQYVEKDLLQRAGAGDALAAKLTADYVWKNLIDQHAGYVAKLNTPGQPMYQKWVTVSITPEQRAEIRGWHREAVQRERLAPIGLGVAGLLGCVGLMHLLLRRKPGRPH